MVDLRLGVQYRPEDRSRCFGDRQPYASLAVVP
jgi:hypothetical protein